jgi:hypothetical protein
MAKATYPPIAAAVILARQAAQREVTRRIKRAGQVRLSSIPASRIARLANEWLEAHPELIDVADPIVREMCGPSTP